MVGNVTKKKTISFRDLPDESLLLKDKNGSCGNAPPVSLCSCRQLEQEYLSPKKQRLG